METKFSGESARFYLSSGLGQPTVFNIIDSINQVVVSGLPVTYDVPSGVYWADYNFDDDFASGLYWTNWQPLDYPFSGLDRIFIFRNDRYRISHPHGRQGFKIEIPDPMSIMYYCVDSGLIPQYSQVDYWLFDYYTFDYQYKNLINQHHPNAKIGISVPAKIDIRWVQDQYQPYALLSGNTSSVTSWQKYFDYEICTYTGLDFYLLSGVQNNDHSDWVFNRDEFIIAHSDKVLTGYYNLLYFESGLQNASKITASGVYLFTNDLQTAGRVACGYFGITDDVGELELKEFNETRYSNGFSFYSIYPIPLGFNSMTNDLRLYSEISTAKISEYANLSRYWRTSQETAYLSSFTDLKNDATAANSNIRLGATLYHTDWPEALWEAEYTSGLSTFGAFMYLTMSGTTDPASSNYYTMWDYSINNLNLDFFIVPYVSQTQRDYLNSKYYNLKELIFKGNDISEKQIMVTGLNLSQAQALYSESRYIWFDDFDIAAYLGQGYSEYGVSL